MAGHPEAVLRAAIRTPCGMAVTPPKPLLAAANCPKLVRMARDTLAELEERR
jgi:hypothetical protein